MANLENLGTWIFPLKYIWWIIFAGKSMYAEVMHKVEFLHEISALMYLDEHHLA